MNLKNTSQSVIIAASLFAGLSSSANLFAQNARSYEVIVAAVNKQQATVSLGATVIPRLEMTIRAQAPGRVVFIAGEEGTKVKKGQTVVDLDDKSLIAQRRAAVAGMQRAKAQLQNANIQLEQNIVSEGHSSRGGMGMPSIFDKMMTQPFGDMMGVGDSDYDRYASINQSRTGVEQAKSAVIEAEARIEQIDSMFRDKKALAPGDAVILQKMVELGDAVQPSQPLVRIGDVSTLRVMVDVPSRLLGALKEGMLVPIAIDVLGLKTQGKVIQVFPSADAQRHTVRVKIDLPAQTGAKPGMYATVQVPDTSPSMASIIMIPSSAIIWRGSQASVFVVNAEGLASLRLIRIGSKSADQTMILSGVSVGDRVISQPDPQLRSGDQVQVLMTQA